MLASLDAHGRPLRNLRVSVTDRCNLRCSYCMPEQEYTWLPRADILDFEEFVRLVRVFAGLGVDRLRLTGGEPLLRRDLATLVRGFAGIEAIGDLALTTNGILLAEQAEGLAEAGLQRVTVSLDTLDEERFERLTRRRSLASVLAGIDAARAAFGGLKIDTVVIRGTNDDELVPLLEFSRAHGAELRFIEYMDVGGATRWSSQQVVPRSEILERLARHYGPISPVPESTSAPADRYRLSDAHDGTVFGVISSTTQPFCGSCDRSRLTADGLWFLCLYATNGVDLRAALRAGASDEELAARIRDVWTSRSNRGAEERLAHHGRSNFVPISELRRDPHLEMHTRGG